MLGIAVPDAQAGREDHLAAVLDGLPMGLVSFTAALRRLFVSARLLELLEVPPGLREDPRDLFAAARSLTPEGRHQACQALRVALRGEAGPPEPVLLEGQRGRSFVLALRRLPDEVWLATLEEVTARRAAEARAREQALRDPLTGLGNRRMFHERLAERLAREGAGAEGALLMLDLDRFKPVNDTLGHQAGDALLQLVADRLRAGTRAGDVIARLGGDEFALLAPAMPDREGAEALARRLVEAVSRPYLVEGQRVSVGASVGIALPAASGREPATLLRHADLALYHSKRGGRGTWSVFEPEMDRRAIARRSLETDLREALPQGELELHYQPQIELETRRVLGFEALLRWRHPGRGLVQPAEFLPLAEEIGLMVPIGEWVLRQACREATGWPDGITVAVNVSPQQFEDAARLTDVVAGALAHTGLSGERLEVEVTEGVLLRNEAAVLAALHRLRAMGVRVAMDDFGTGYSSLNQLRSFPFDKIKIDRSFLGDTPGSDGRDAIIRAITALGASLGMPTIAEGVETPDQLARLRSEGCRSVQGYLFSAPVLPDQVGNLLAAFARPA